MDFHNHKPAPVQHYTWRGGGGLGGHYYVKCVDGKPVDALSENGTPVKAPVHFKVTHPSNKAWDVCTVEEYEGIRVKPEQYFVYLAKANTGSHYLRAENGRIVEGLLQGGEPYTRDSVFTDKPVSDLGDSLWGPSDKATFDAVKLAYAANMAASKVRVEYREWEGAERTGTCYIKAVNGTIIEALDQRGNTYADSQFVGSIMQDTDHSQFKLITEATYQAVRCPSTGMSKGLELIEQGLNLLKGKQHAR